MTLTAPSCPSAQYAAGRSAAAGRGNPGRHRRQGRRRLGPALGSRSDVGSGKTASWGCSDARLRRAFRHTPEREASAERYAAIRLRASTLYAHGVRNHQHHQRAATGQHPVTSEYKSGRMRACANRWVMASGGALLDRHTGCLLAVRHQLRRQYAPADIAFGARIYAAQCSTCHAPTGDGVGGVDLRSGKFRNASTDQNLALVIQNGIPGTGMNGFRLTPGERDGIIAYLAT